MILNTTNNKLLLAYKGPFFIDILTCFGGYIKKMFGHQSQTGYKLYKVFFELTQNVAKYSVETSPVDDYKYSGVGSFNLEENDDLLILSTTNLIFRKDGFVLQKYCDEINSLNKSELREIRGETRKQSLDEKDTGAHIGIIQIGLLSLHRLDFEIQEFNDEYSIFKICTTITKE